MSTLQEPPKVMPVVPSPRNSSVPLLADRRGTEDSTSDEAASTPKQGGKRRFFGLGRKKDGDKDKSTAPDHHTTGPSANTTIVPSTAPMLPPVTGIRPISPISAPAVDSRPALVSTPQSSPRVYASSAASPSRGLRSSSPRLHSPASSQIFERNVQESHMPGELSPAIPAHIQTEDHIPPVLEASAQAITDDHLTPDEVEIVMHAAHQPAASNIGNSPASAEAVSSPTIDEVASKSETDDGQEAASNYGSFDKDDVRRLSFISFADVVQAEHAETSRDSVHHMSLSTTANRSPSPTRSPVRSPASSRGVGTSPPTSGAPSMKGMDAAKNARVPGAPASPTLSQGAYSPPLSGSEIMVETMRQALRKTGSGDLSGARSQSQPMSAASAEADGVDRPPFQ
ncbi:hypothetical protein IWZ00DRAFT_62327 [Phyllosticta capitalensis]|uniref:uncharacterized protein n=1 Tax=Phyllosticta capitalensis TaxID=121624 RepID=UPI003131F396